MEQSRSQACRLPFDPNPGLCRSCRTQEDEIGLLRCSKVVAESAAMHELMRQLRPIARSSASVVIHGETGTGKEVVARLLHVNSPRRTQPFLAVNVAALPTELLESELFGHIRGAFTGAFASRVGLFEAAHGGTLFLDEIAEMPLPLQAKLLRALQDGEIRRVGDSQSFGVDVRIVCATHRDLADYVARGLFRDDLYYRLKVFTVSIPPLRQRTEDIRPLAVMLAEREGVVEPQLTEAALRRLESHAWPGNVRELENAMRHAVALAEGRAIDEPHLPRDLGARPRRVDAEEDLVPLAEVERRHIAHVLEVCGGNQAQAARVLGIGRNTLWRKMRLHQLTAPS